MAQAIEQVLHRHYANWADETIPATHLALDQGLNQQRDGVQGE
jgi:hypothetical protein